MLHKPISKSISKKVNSINQFSDAELLQHIQQQTFRYFWDFAHPSGMIRERNHESYKNVVTSGGTGFGLMCIVVAMERKWISLEQGTERIKNIISFLNTCQKYDGAFSHWYNGNTGATIPFSKKDDGADLVETSFLVVGLLTVRQFLKKTDNHIHLIHSINTIWHNINWQAFTRQKNVLYWHSKTKGKPSVNLKIEGYNEALIVYILAASSPTKSIDKKIYDEGWARSGNMKSGKISFDTKLPLGPNYGGPLFFAQYSFLGLDPRGLKDAYANYWQQNLAHTQINYKYCVENPKGYSGYGKDCWGLSSCDSGKRYKMHSPEKDNGTICCSAAIAAIPYLPVESLKALKNFYYNMGKKIWGEYGFYDSFNKTRSWCANSYLSINQGPIILMIENYRTGLLWNLFMSCKEVQLGLKKLGFLYSH